MLLKISLNNFEQKVSFAYDKINSIPVLIKKNYNPDSVFLITDTNLIRIYKTLVYDYFHKEFGERLKIFIIEAGERSKSQKVRNTLEKIILKEAPTKNSFIVALGGGVVGDLAGLIAATIHRGINYINIPTSIISQIDSSIGGKNGINVNSIKNSIGTIYQPKIIFTDTAFLKTLPKDEYLSGLAEVIKTFVIYDKKYYEYFIKNYKKILERNTKCLNILVKECIRIKSEVVSQDISDKNIRRILNFGHTFGHALESLSNYKLKHGYAVAEGMIIESILSNKLGYLSTKEMNDFTTFLKKMFSSKILINKYNFNKLFHKLLFDKKNDFEHLNFSLIDKIGSCLYNVKIRKELLKSNLI